MKSHITAPAFVEKKCLENCNSLLRDIIFAVGIVERRRKNRPATVQKSSRLNERIELPRIQIEPPRFFRARLTGSFLLLPVRLIIAH